MEARIVTSDKLINSELHDTFGRIRFGQRGVSMKTRILRFGPFELDAAQQQLRKRGIPLKVPASRIRLLHLLAGRHGELITRDEIAACLWSDSKAVDIITGINTAMNQLRSVLGDDAATPKYIVTVIGAGYRFVAKVTESEATTEDVSFPSAVGLASEAISDLPSSTAAAPAWIAVTKSGSSSASTGHFNRQAKLITAALVVAILLVASSLFFLDRRARAHRSTEQRAMELSRVTTSGDIQFADISPDGNFVVYVREVNGEEELWLKQLATERTLLLASLGTFHCPGLAFSPDGNNVYYVRKQILEAGGELYRVPLLGGISAKVLDRISGAPAISPDGRTVAFVRSTLVTHGQDSIVTASLDGTNEKTLATYDAPGIHFNRLTWTSDGKSLVFPVQSSLMVLSATGTRATPLNGSDWVDIDDVAKLPPGRNLIVAGVPKGSSRRQILEVSLDDGSAYPISHDLSSYMTIRASADGQTLLAVQTLTLSSIGDVTVQNGSTAIRPLSKENQNNAGLAGVAWTPRGTVLYTADTERTAELDEVGGDGSNPRRLMSTETQMERYSDPVVSALGNFMAVARWRSEDRANIWRIKMDGSLEKRLTDGAQDFPPSITPDGKWVVYASVQGDRSVLMKVPSEGGAPIWLTDYDADSPSVSPNGLWIACLIVSHPDKSPSLAIVRIAGGPPVKVFPLPESAAPLSLNWTPDGRAVSFINNVNGVGNIWQQPLAGGPPTPVTHFTSGKVFNFDWSRDGRLALSHGAETTDAVLIRNFLGGR